MIFLFSVEAMAQDSEVGSGTPIELMRVPLKREPIKIIQIPQISQNPQPSLRYPDHGLPTKGKSNVELAKEIYPLKYIDGCNRTHNIGFKFYLEGQLTCDFSVRIHPHAVRFLDQNLHECTSESLKSIGINKPVAKVNIFSQGVFNKRRIYNRKVGLWSNHSLGAAVDMSDVEVEYEDGSKDVFPVSAKNPRNGKRNAGFTPCTRNCRGRRFNKSGRALFYNGFYSCMNQKAEAIISQNKAKGISCTGGVLGCDYNSAHDDHIHLSVPICPRPKGVATI